MSVKQGNQTHKIEVFYDGACSLCAHEINHYKAIAPSDIFVWIDITQDMERFKSLGFTQEQGLKALHAYTVNGIMHIGVDAFIVIWKELKRWKVLAALINLPFIRHIAQFFYKHFAAWRYKKLGYGICN
ncbi:MAG: DUF393 domain-containing protein [Pseudomonadota bacterium]